MGGFNFFVCDICRESTHVFPTSLLANFNPLQSSDSFMGKENDVTCLSFFKKKSDNLVLFPGIWSQINLWYKSSTL